MATSNLLCVTTIIAYLALFSGPGLAQRPANASLCDYYAQARYGANTSDTQLKFIQNVVCLAFEGGSRLTNKSSEITGILRPGTFNGVNIDLLQFFNGSRASTNVNNAPIGINWLDQGGTTPLANFLAGQTLDLASTSNQYRAFGCSLPPPPLSGTNGPAQPAYVHKFMNLEYNQLGYFINQLSLAAIYFGMSPQDADTFRTTLNSRYNVRCAPAVSIPPAAPQLFSLCQNPTCPLAVPVSDCAAYANLTATGIVSSDPNTVTSTAIKTAIPTNTGGPALPIASATSMGSNKLSTGGIVGAAVGGAAVLLVAAIALLYFLRKRRTTPTAAAAATAPVTRQNQPDYASPLDHPSSTYFPKHPHQSYYSTSQPMSEMDSSGFQDHINTGSPLPSPGFISNQEGNFNSRGLANAWIPAPVEMPGAETVGEARALSPAPEHQVWSEEQQQQNSDTYFHDQEYYAQQHYEGFRFL